MCSRQHFTYVCFKQVNLPHFSIGIIFGGTYIDDSAVNDQLKYPLFAQCLYNCNEF
jgi:hypothetical protein